MSVCARMRPAEIDEGRTMSWTMRSTFEHDVRHVDFSLWVASMMQVLGQLIGGLLR